MSLLVSCSFILSKVDTYKDFVILIPSYNNEPYAKPNILSAFQDYPEDHYRIIYVNDCSQDNTLPLIEETVTQNNKQHLTTIIDNQDRKGALQNLYEVINNYIEDKEIVVILDGDDQLAHKDVLSWLNEFYTLNDIWLSYGQFMHSSDGHIGFCQPMPADIVKNNAFRQWRHGASHLKTFYAKLFKNIKYSDLTLNDVFFEMCYDLAIMFPMIEQARDHFAFIPKVLYLYNDINPISDHRKSKDLQRQLDLYIRALPRYNPLDVLF